MVSSAPAPRLTSTGEIERLRADLRAADYTVDHVADLLGPTAGAALHREQPTAARRVLRASDDPSALLVRFFTLGEAVPYAALSRALPSCGPDGLQRLGVARAVREQPGAMDGGRTGDQPASPNRPGAENPPDVARPAKPRSRAVDATGVARDDVRGHGCEQAVDTSAVDGLDDVPEAERDEALGANAREGVSGNDCGNDSGIESLDSGPDASAGSALWRATCDLRPYGDETHSWWLASDLSEIATGGTLPEDHVLGIGGASTTLARWTPRRPVRSALDLGTGCGVQAVHLAGHADAVVATDLAERALAFVRFNAALGEMDVDVLAGSMLEPVAGRRFDLVVSNPPFVITPRIDGMPAYEYRDGGAVGDAVVRDLVRDVGAHLEPGGVAQFLGNWEMREGHGYEDVWQEWLDGVDLDAWVVQREVQDPCEYAELWARDGGAAVGSPDYDAMYGAWLDDFAARGVTSIGFGVITLQRPTQDRTPFVDLMDERGHVASPMGPTIDAGLVARTWIAAHTDDDLLDSTWAAAPDVTEERHTTPGADDPSVIMIRQGGGLALAIQADTVLAAFMSVCDGSMTARTALVAIATLVDVPEPEVIEGTLPLLRRLVANGFLRRDGA